MKTRQRGQQELGVRVPRRDQYPLCRTELHLLATVGHRDAVTEIASESEVVGDEEHRDPGILLEVLEQVHDLRLHADVEGRSGLVENQHVGIERECGGDTDALALPAAELVWVAAGEIGWEPDPLQKVTDAVAGGRLVESPIEQEGLRYLLADAKDGIEHAHGAFQDHGDATPANFAAKLIVRKGDQLLAVEPHRAIEAGDVPRQHAHQCQGQAALAAAGLADDAESLATLLERERDTIHRPHDVAVAGVIPEMEIVDD